MELKKKKFNRPFVMSLQLAVILGGLGIWLLMFFNNGRVTVSLEIIKYLPYLFYSNKIDQKESIPVH